MREKESEREKQGKREREREKNFIITFLPTPSLQVFILSFFRYHLFPLLISFSSSSFTHNQDHYPYFIIINPNALSQFRPLSFLSRSFFLSHSLPLPPSGKHSPSEWARRKFCFWRRKEENTFDSKNGRMCVWRRQSAQCLTDIFPLCLPMREAKEKEKEREWGRRKRNERKGKVRVN